jgi:hypothetical protein
MTAHFVGYVHSLDWRTPALPLKSMNVKGAVLANAKLSGCTA